ncbi:glycosyl transferase family protein [Croceicoccus ponticola]|uniref:Glycosyl transferase family protein n=1 Tax=Croceicoccus ponticola TaxID=2217664 RepID=A0A437GX42_9SPHN|nr:glycosyl transferase family protein [Croceicoccus ponticola]RVQ66491.1 glycosyl transferase family protein [Croceicoccus ponticola]
MGVAAQGWLLELLTFVEAARLELLLFAGFWFLLGALDELAIDAAWFWLLLTGRARTETLDGPTPIDLGGRIALFVPAWNEARVIGPMIRHTLAVWPHRDLRVYAGCYVNDPDTRAAMLAAGGDDPRLRVVVNEVPGPTTKGQCLNRLYHAMREDEARDGIRARAVLLHDAEDMVHPDALTSIDRALDDADFVQIPVRPEMQDRSPWVGNHYADEFTDAHAREMVVRDKLGAGLPAAGVGCAFARGALEQVAEWRGNGRDGDPFDPDAMTEDYELGMLIGRKGSWPGGKGGRFLRIRVADGSLVATRAYFPASLDAAVRQKSRWVQGIAFDGWDQLGWSLRPVELWMRLRDRRGPLIAVVLAAAYLLVVLTGLLWLADAMGWYPAGKLPTLVYWVLIVTTLAFAWRAAIRFVLVGREYGWADGLAAVLRIPVANVIAIIATRRAVFLYAATLFGKPARWDKTEHDLHPADQHAAGRSGSLQPSSRRPA